MKTTHFLALALVVLAGPAYADLKVSNPLVGKYRIDVTLPNGAVQHRSVSEGSEELFAFAPGIKTVGVAIVDDAEATVWSGEAAFDDVLLLVPNGEGVKAIKAGTYAGKEGPRAAVFVNLSGEPVTIDLEGQNGLGAHRGITPGTSFDLKKAVKLDPREASFKVVGKTKNGDAIDFDGSSVSASRYYVIYKNGQGAFRLRQLGVITPSSK